MRGSSSSLAYDILSKQTQFEDIKIIKWAQLNVIYFDKVFTVNYSFIT